VTVPYTVRAELPSPPTSPTELKAVLEAQRAGVAFLVLRDGEGVQRIVTLGPSDHLTIGRGPGNEVALAWDPNASRVHAALERVGGVWTLVDDGMSRNGSWVNGARVDGRRRLAAADVVRIGDTALTFHAPDEEAGEATVPDATGHPPPELTPMQRRVLVALARPCGTAAGPRPPAPNAQIAAELFLSVDGVKAHLRALFAKFGVAGLAQNEKRFALVREAFASGAISPAEL